MKKPIDDEEPTGDPLVLVRRALSGLRFGEIVIAVHDGEIVQVSRTEKIRLAKGRT